MTYVKEDDPLNEKKAKKNKEEMDKEDEIKIQNRIQNQIKAFEQFRELEEIENKKKNDFKEDHEKVVIDNLKSDAPKITTLYNYYMIY